MLFSYNLLKRYIKFNFTPVLLADKLTMQGLEVEEISNLDFDFNFFRVAVIRKIEICDNSYCINVFDGEKSYKTFLDSKFNLEVSNLVCIAFPGAILGSGNKINFSNTSSEARILSKKDLEISHKNNDIFILPSYAREGDDINFYVSGKELFLKVVPTSNRNDCFSLIGVAREIAVFCDSKILYPSYNFDIDFSVTVPNVKISDNVSDLCLRYCGRLIKGIKISDSPSWLKNAILSFGIRPINNIIDIVNYISFELGYALHTYDFDKIQGDEIIVRKANPSEKVHCITDRNFILDNGMLTISDSSNVIGIAGILGSYDTMVTDSTVNIFLESAFFDSNNVSVTCDKLNLNTDASSIFKRGVSIYYNDYALNRVTDLILDICGGSASKLVDIYPKKKVFNEFTLTEEDVFKVIGNDISIDDCKKYLKLLEYDILNFGQDFITCRIPYFRYSIHSVSDVIEDIMRVYGYSNISYSEPFTRFNLQNKFVSSDYEQDIKEKLVAFGFFEIFNSSFIYDRDLSSCKSNSSGAIIVKNPLTLDHKYLRKDLFFGSINTVSYNFYNGFKSLRLFEISNVFRKNSDYIERKHCSVSLYGFISENNLYEKEKMANIFDLKGIFESLFDFFDIKAKFIEEEHRYFTSSESFGIYISGIRVGFLGKCSDDICASYKLTLPLFYGEINLETFFSFIKKDNILYKPISKFPSVFRDLVVLIDERLSVDMVYSEIISSSFVRSAEIVDIYRGKNIPDGKKSVAYKIVFQNSSDTLSNEFIDKEYDSIVDNIRKNCFGEMRAI